MVLTFSGLSCDEKPPIRRRCTLLTGIGLLTIIASVTAYVFGSETINYDALLWLCSTGLFIILVSLFKATTWQGYNRIILVSGLAITLLFLLLMVVNPNSAGTVSFQAGLTFGIILLFIAGIRLRKRKDSEIQDERTKKIGTYGISCSWYLTYLIIIILFWATYTGFITISTSTLFLILILVMPVSNAVFQWYYSQKGDVY